MRLEHDPMWMRSIMRKKNISRGLRLQEAKVKKRSWENELDQIIAENKKEIKAAEYDQKHCDKEYSDELVRSE